MNTLLEIVALEKKSGILAYFVLHIVSNIAVKHVKIVTTVIVQL